MWYCADRRGAENFMVDLQQEEAGAMKKKKKKN
jgi:hypothetical protein